MTEEMYKKCNYRFKGSSCKECPLGCIGKVDELTRLKQEDKQMKSILEEIREYCNSEHGSVYVIIDKINEVLGNECRE